MTKKLLRFASALLTAALVLTNCSDPLGGGKEQEALGYVSVALGGGDGVS